MKQTNSFTKIIVSTALALVSLQVFAGPGALVTSPLFVNSAAKPNILFLTDTSGSMRHVVPEDSLGVDADKYDSGTTYLSSCGSATTPNDTTNGSPASLYIRIVSNVPKIGYARSSGSTYFLGTASGEVCFDSTLNYNASLNADAGNNAAGSATALYSGNYLNWYFDFDNTTTTWSSGEELKPGTDYRMNIARTTLKAITDNLDDNVRVGLARLYSDTGAKIEFEIADLTAANKVLVKAEIDTFVASGVTPMAEALLQVGRYFLGDSGTTSATAPHNGQYSGDLKLHPDATTPETQAHTAVFPTNYINPSDSSGGLESPIEYWCQNNFVVFMSDGVSRDDLNIPDVDRSIPALPVPSILADYDGDCPLGGTCDRDNDRKPTADGYIYDTTNDGSDYLDDVAQALFEIDLRPDINDDQTIPQPALNNIITYTIAFADLDALNNKLLDDAATQAGGIYFASADATELVQDFASATNSILSTTSSAAAVTFNTSTLGSNTAVYQALFNTSFWSGEIKSFPIDQANGDVLSGCTIDTANCWLASTHMDALAYDTATSTFVDNRQIITFDAANKKGVAFNTPTDFTAPATNEITTAMINDLCAGPDAPLVGGVACTSATSGAKTDSQEFVSRMVNYVRGDRTFEDLTTTPIFRTRQTVLGDIINATPAFISKPSLPWPSLDTTANKFGEGPLGGGNRYNDYKTAQINRQKILYVSSNDGMLHAINTETLSASLRDKGGDELFAYIPSFVFSDQADEGLHHLAEPTYTHKYYLDLAPTYTDIYGYGKDATNSPSYSTASRAWRTVLLGGSRGGTKKGLFALDVTDPSTITEANAANTVLWEFTNSDDVDLGFTFSKPTIALTNAVDGTGANRWAAIFGNGYQSDITTVTNGSSCHAVLYVVFMEGCLDGTWTLGTNPATADYMKIDTEVGTTTAGDCNGLSTPALIDTDGDQILDRVYAGDVQGNMWAFDLTCGGSCAFDIPYSQGATPKPLFTAKDSLGGAQPIMVKPNIARNTAVQTSASNKPNVLVIFGTGQYHNNSDSTGTTKTNTVYGIWDSGTGKLTDNRANDSSTGSTLVGQTITTSLSGDLRNITSNTVDWSSKYGWYIDLNPKDLVTLDAEERVVVSGSIHSDVFFFNTLIPNGKICGSGGFGWLMSVNFLTGGETDTTIFDANNNGVVDGDDNIGGDVAVGKRIDGIPASSTFFGDRRYTQTTKFDDPNCPEGICDDEIKLDTPQTGRLSWRELRSN